MAGTGGRHPRSRPGSPTPATRASSPIAAILTQEVYQILAGYPDGDDAQALRDDPLFQTLVAVALEEDQPLANGSTLNRSHQAYTCRQANLPLAERLVRGDSGLAVPALWSVRK